MQGKWQQCRGSRKTLQRFTGATNAAKWVCSSSTTQKRLQTKRLDGKC